MRVTDGQTYRQTDRQTDGQNSHRYTASAFHAARYRLPPGVRVQLNLYFNVSL